MSMDTTALYDSLDDSTSTDEVDHVDTTEPVEAVTEEVENSGDGQESFPASYVRELREEAASRRVALKPYEDAFGTYNDEERQIWLQLAKITAENPAEGAKYMKQIADALERQHQPVDTSSLSPEERARLAAREELDSFRTEQEEQRRQESLEQQAREINKKATELGYSLNTPGYMNLLWYAQNKTEGNLDKAHELVQADVQKIVDSYVASKRENPPLPPEARDALGESKQPKTIEEASSAFTAWLDAQP